MENWLSLLQSRPYLYVIRERLDHVDPRFLTEYTNIYLVVGEHSALLIDTGTGIGSLSELITPLIADRDLIVINSHNHFDHVGGNYQFQETAIHRMDFKKLMTPMSVEYLQESLPGAYEYFKERNFKIEFATTTIPLIGGEEFDLGGFKATVVHTPGHTPGSICILLSTGELFTGDTLHYGSIYLPDQSNLHFLNETITYLQQLKVPNLRFFPGHEGFDLGRELLDDYLDASRKLDWSKSEYDDFLSAEILIFEKFTFVRPKPESSL